MIFGSSTQFFRSDITELPRLEAYLRSLNFLREDELNRLLIISADIFDNLISHSKNLGSGVTLKVSRLFVTRMEFIFKSSNFAAFAPHERAAERRYFDEASHRYRGLGLRMCRRLSRAMYFRSGAEADSIIVKV